MGTLLKIRSFWANDLFWKKKNLKYTAVFFQNKPFKKQHQKSDFRETDVMFLVVMSVVTTIVVLKIMYQKECLAPNLGSIYQNSAH